MTWEHKERIIEAGLEEVVGGQYPPDLSAKILQTLDIRRQAAQQASGPIADAASSPPLALQSALSVPPPVQAAVEPPPPPTYSEPVVHVTGEPRSRRGRRAAWFGLVVAA